MRQSLTGILAEFKNPIDFYTGKAALQSLFDMLDLQIDLLHGNISCSVSNSIVSFNLEIPVS